MQEDIQFGRYCVEHMLPAEVGHIHPLPRGKGVPFRHQQHQFIPEQPPKCDSTIRDLRMNHRQIDLAVEQVGI